MRSLDIFRICNSDHATSNASSRRARLISASSEVVRPLVDLKKITIEIKDEELNESLDKTLVV